jgi:ribosomal protein L40E
MRVCRRCQRVNGDTDDVCRQCGVGIATQVRLHAEARVPRPLPDVIARRNRGYLILLALLPLAVLLNLAFWAASLPAYFHERDTARQARAEANLTMLRDGLAKCRSDTGGVPLRLETLRNPAVNPGDLSPGGDATRWNGPYLPTDVPFPENPYRPDDGPAGWQYAVHGDNAEVRALGEP